MSRKQQKGPEGRKGKTEEEEALMSINDTYEPTNSKKDDNKLSTVIEMTAIAQSSIEATSDQASGYTPPHDDREPNDCCTFVDNDDPNDQRSDRLRHHQNHNEKLKQLVEQLPDSDGLRALCETMQIDHLLTDEIKVELDWSVIAEVDVDSESLSNVNGDKMNENSVPRLRKIQKQTKGTVLHMASALGHLDIVQYLVKTMGQSVDVLSDSGSTPICLAVAHSHLLIVEFLHKAGAKLDVVDRTSLTFLGYAVLSGSSNTVTRALEMLKMNGIISEKMKSLLTDFENPLQLAVKHGLCEVVQTLLDDSSIRDLLIGSNRLITDTALHKACRSRSPEATKIVRQLLEASADLGQLNEEDETPFMLAAKVGNVETVKLLSQHIKDYSKSHVPITISEQLMIDFATGNNHYYPVSYACESISLRRLSYFFSLRNKSRKSVWNYAIERASNDVLTALLEAAWFLCGIPAPEDRRIELPSRGEFTGQAAAVESAVDETWLQKLQYFFILRDGKDSTTPLHVAACKGDVEKLKIMLNYGFQLEKMLDSMGNTFLHTAAEESRVDVVRTFATSPLYVNQKNKDGDSVLSVACSKGKYECIWLLLPSADLSLVNKHKRTALHELCVLPDLPISLLRHVVVRSDENLASILLYKDETDRSPLNLLSGNPNLNQKKLVFKLFYRSLEINLKWNDFNTELRKPLQEALYNLCVDNALALMSTFESMLDVNAVDVFGLTSLHVAVKQCLSQAVKPLIEAGADLSSYDKEGNSPLHTLVTFACEQPKLQKEYIELLQVVLDCAVLWYCKKNNKPVLSKESADYQECHRKAVTKLLTLVYNSYKMNVLMWAAYKCVDCKELLSTLLTVPDVFCRTSLDPEKPHESNPEYVYYDVTNIVPVTMDTLPRKIIVSSSSTTAETSDSHVHIDEEHECATFPKNADLEYRRHALRASHATLTYTRSLVDIIVGTCDCSRGKRLQLLDVSPIHEITMTYSDPYILLYSILMYIHLIYMLVFAIVSLPFTTSADLSCAYQANETSGFYSNVSRIKELPSESGLYYVLLIWPCLIILLDSQYCFFYLWWNGFKYPSLFRKWSFIRAMSAPFRPKEIASVDLFWCCGSAFSLLVFSWFVLSVQRTCYQDQFLAGAMIFGCLYLMNFMQAYSRLFRFMLIFQKILQELIRFYELALPLLLGYALAFMVLDLSVLSLLQEFPSTGYVTRDVLRRIAGFNVFYEKQPNELASLGKNETTTNIIYASNLVLLGIVLLNMLTFSMNETFSSIDKSKQHAYHLSWLQRVLDIESDCGIFGKLIRKLRITYSGIPRKIPFFMIIVRQNVRSYKNISDVFTFEKRFYVKVKRVDCAWPVIEMGTTPEKHVQVLRDDSQE